MNAHHVGEVTTIALVKQHPILTYYVLAFAISWGAILLIVGPGGFLTTTSTSPSFALAGFASLLGPSLAGVVLTGLVDGRAGLARPSGAAPPLARRPALVRGGAPDRAARHDPDHARALANLPGVRPRHHHGG